MATVRISARMFRRVQMPHRQASTLADGASAHQANMSQQAAGFLARPPFNHHWVLPDQDGKLHYLDRFEWPFFLGIATGVLGGPYLDRTYLTPHQLEEIAQRPVDDGQTQGKTPWAKD